MTLLNRLTDRALNRVFGIKRKRLPEWRAVLRQEGHNAGWPRTARSLAVAAFWALRRGKVAGNVWKARIRDCRACPIYDRKRRACRDTHGLGAGCGCWMPLKAWFNPSCWLRERGTPTGFGHKR